MITCAWYSELSYLFNESEATYRWKLLASNLILDGESVLPSSA